MKKEQRRPWLGVVTVESARAKTDEYYIPFLCGECKYFREYHDYEYGDDCECVHPLETARDMMEHTFEGYDCYFFRPRRMLAAALADLGITERGAIQQRKKWENAQDRESVRWTLEQKKQDAEWRGIVEKAYEEGFIE